MAWDLWSSSYDEVFYDGDNSEWQCDCFDWGRDTIEEDALNRKSCAQVLKILNTKGDTEIEELENDLSSLQNEFAWTEDANWRDMCSSTLNEKLDVEVSSLKTDGDRSDDTGTQLLLDSKPAETLNEIVKPLQSDHSHDTQGQEHLDANIPNPIVNVTEHALDNDSNNSDSNGITRDEGNEHYRTLENPTSSKLLLELHEKISDDPEKTEELLATSPLRTSNLGALSCVPDLSDGMALSDTLGNNVTERSQLITTDTSQILNPFSSNGNGHIPSEVKKEDTTVKENVCPDGYRFPIGIEGMKVYRSRFTTGHRQETGNSDLDRKLCDFAPKTARRARRKESKVAPEEDLKYMNMPLQVVYPKKWCFADTELSSFKGTKDTNSLQAMNIEKATCVNGENSTLISLPGIQTKNALCTGLDLTGEEKPQARDLKFESAANCSKSNMCFPSRPKAQGKKKPELDVCSAEELLDSPTEITCKTISTSRQRKSKTCKAGVILNEPMDWIITKKTVHPGHQETEGTDSTSKNFSTNRQRKPKTGKADVILNETTNRKKTKKAVPPGHHETEAHAIVPYDSNFSATELHDSPLDVIPITSEKVSTKRKRKPKTCTSGVIPSRSTNRKITKTDVMPGQHETERHAIVLYDNNFSESQKKSRALMFPINSEIPNSTVSWDITSSDRVPMDNESQDNSKSLSLVDFNNESLALVPVRMTNSRMTDYLTQKKLIDLRDMAKQYKIKQYYKLPKGALVAQLAELL